MIFQKFIPFLKCTYQYLGYQPLQQTSCKRTNVSINVILNCTQSDVYPYAQITKFWLQTQMEIKQWQHSSRADQRLTHFHSFSKNIQQYKLKELIGLLERLNYLLCTEKLKTIQGMSKERSSSCHDKKLKRIFEL